MSRRILLTRLDGLFGSVASTIAVLGLVFAASFEPLPSAEDEALSFLFQLMILLIALSTGVFFALIGSSLYKQHRLFGFLAALFSAYVLGLAISGLLDKLLPHGVSHDDAHLLLRVFSYGGAISAYTAYFIQRLYMNDFRHKEEEWWGPGGRGMQSQILLVAFAVPYAVGAASDFTMF